MNYHSKNFLSCRKGNLLNMIRIIMFLISLFEKFYHNFSNTYVDLGTVNVL